MSLPFKVRLDDSPVLLSVPLPTLIVKLAVESMVALLKAILLRAISVQLS